MTTHNSLNAQSILIALSFLVLGFTASLLFLERGQIQEAENVASNAPAEVLADLSTITADDDAFMGDPNAPITMIEFSDFQCPYCRSFYNETLPLLKKNFIDKGLMKFVYRDLPIVSLGHTGAYPAANAAECARKQGGDEIFFAFHDLIFEGQNEKGSGTVSITQDELTAYAERLDLDMNAFQTCQDNESYYSEIENDLNAARAVGMRGTPTFVINGQMVKGAQTYSVFEELLNSLL